MAISQFQKYIKENQIHNLTILETEEPTHTADAAAMTHGVPVSNIVKSLLVIGEHSEAFLVLVPGDKRLNLELISDVLGFKVRMAKADEVKRITGYSIGGVPPFGHLSSIKTFIVNGFVNSLALYAAAGASNAVFKTSFEDLVKYCSAELIEQ